MEQDPRNELVRGDEWGGKLRAGLFHRRAFELLPAGEGYCSLVAGAGLLSVGCPRGAERGELEGMPAFADRHFQ